VVYVCEYKKEHEMAEMKFEEELKKLDREGDQKQATTT